MSNNLQTHDDETEKDCSWVHEDASENHEVILKEENFDTGTEYDENKFNISTCKNETDIVEVKLEPLDNLNSSCTFDSESTNSNDTDYHCKICQKSFDRRSDLSEHLKSHRSESDHICKICSKRFTTFISLYQHLKTQHSDKNYDCKICFKSFTLKKYLNQHLQTHISDKNYECTICTKSFTTPEYLKRHENRHTDKNFICKTCSKKFKNQDTLYKHMKIHSEEWTRKCKVCSERFKTDESLCKHIKTHKEANYKCALCFKHYKFRRNMYRHMKTHSGNKSSNCKVCTRSFENRKNLLQHMMVSHVIHTLAKDHEKHIDNTSFLYADVDVKLEPTKIFIPEGLTSENESDYKSSINPVIKVEEVIIKEEDVKHEHLEVDTVEVKQEILDMDEEAKYDSNTSFIRNHKGNFGDIKLEIDDECF